MDILLIISWFVIFVLSTYRLTVLLHEEDGPGEIVKKLRLKLGVIEFNNLTADEQEEIVLFLDLDEGDELPLYDIRTFSGKLFDCISCLSIWTAFPHATIFWITLPITSLGLQFTTGSFIILIPIITFAMSAIIIYISNKE